MKKRLLSLLLALVGLTATAVAENYGIKIGGVAVTSDNYTDITSSNFPAVMSGTVTYDPSTRTLTLKNANITGKLSFYNNSAGFTLSLPAGTMNVVSSYDYGLTVEVPLTILGGGTLVVSSTSYPAINLYYAASSDYTLSIENSTVIATGKGGINGIANCGTLNIDNSTVMATGTVLSSGTRKASVKGMKAVTLTGSELHTPAGAAWDETAHAVCDAEGATVTSTVMFAPGSGSGSGSGLVGDVNNDNLLTVADVTALVNLIVNGGNGGQQQDAHGYVDLGLPSGTKWATCNIGADNPEDEGDYFAWGETVPYGGEDTSNAHNYNYAGSYRKTYYSWDTYKYCNGSTYKTLTKYCSKSAYGYNGFTDNNTVLQLGDDAAYVNWGENWRMPSLEQCEELINGNYTSQVWTTVNGVDGLMITSVKPGYTDRSIFLPAVGNRNGYGNPAGTNFGYYWTRTLETDRPDQGKALSFQSSGTFTSGFSTSRYYGYSIRPVRNQ